jgi:hypothetical protein
VTVDTSSADLLQSGGVHIHPHMRRALLSCFGLFVGVSDMGPAVRLDQNIASIAGVAASAAAGISGGNGAADSDGE